jgi:hypothetical protein
VASSCLPRRTSRTRYGFWTHSQRDRTLYLRRRCHLLFWSQSL